MMKGWKVTSITMLLLAGSGPSNASELVFDADFNNTPDWSNEEVAQRLRYPGDTLDPSAAANIPGNFDSYYTSEWWHPNGSSGKAPVPGSKPVASIDGSQSRQAGGKSFVVYDESYGTPGGWGADAQLGKDLPGVYDELWVEFYIKFQQDWVWMDVENGSGQTITKLFRARYVPENYKEETRYDFFGVGGRAKAPVYMLDLKSWTKPDSSIARLTPFIRGFTPQELIGVDEHYFLKEYEEETSIYQGNKDSLSFAEVFQTGDWVKVNIRIKMDSAPGAGDGVEEVWINDVLEKKRTDIPFRREGEGQGVGFNWISIGGNTHNYPYPDEAQHEQWYAVTDLKVWNGKPSTESAEVKPNPPSDLDVR
ncbi:hypothetical protein [Marinobacter sp.]|uniref:hypothetical protein n=1 Tax=Marinobacter sp. TaxID=50741 RepID=UPI003561E74D